MANKIVAIENTVWGKPLVWKQNEAGALFSEPLPEGITRLEDSVKSSSASAKLPTTEHADT